jgi:hypothetical protein
VKYQKLTVEMVVFPEDAEAVIAALNSAIDRIAETRTIFGGAIETTPIEHRGTRRKSALRHAVDAGKTATSGIRLAAQKATEAYKKVI